MKRSFVLLLSLLLLTALFAGFSRNTQISPSQTVKNYLDSGDNSLWDNHLRLSFVYGSYWQGLTDEEKNKLADIYNRMPNEKIDYIDKFFFVEERVKNKTAEVDVKVIAKGKQEIWIFELYNKNDRWLIYNLSTKGIDSSIMYKELSKKIRYIESKLGGFDSLIEFLERTIINGENTKVVMKEMESNHLHQKVPEKKK